MNIQVPPFIETGDEIIIDAEHNKITLKVSDKELNNRKSKWIQPPYKFKRGVLYKYIKIGPFDSHCVRKRNSKKLSVLEATK